MPESTDWVELVKQLGPVLGVLEDKANKRVPGSRSMSMSSV